MKKALITGVTGQDGFYLANYLLSLGYEVGGIVRRTSVPNDFRIKALYSHPYFRIFEGDVTDLSSIESAVLSFGPDEFYHLAAFSHVGSSWGSPIATCDIVGLGTLNCLEALRRAANDCRFYFAGSSEQFGNTILDNKPLNESSLMKPESPYAAAKVFGYNITHVYRNSYNLFTSVGILMNHESPLRGDQFVTKKITKGLAKIACGKQKKLTLGNINAFRDWGFAGDFVVAMHKILNHHSPDDFVIATGETHSVSEFLSLTCQFFNLDPSKVVEIDHSLYRPKDVDKLLGDFSKAKNMLGWEPQTSFKSLVEMMCQYDFARESGQKDLSNLLGVKLCTKN